jgi:ubiquinone/menaquinone biosynthesis C-methylase UbiE
LQPRNGFLAANLSYAVSHNESKERDAMSTPTNPRREHPSTYFVQDRSNEEELSRLQTQDQMVTTSMGGVLPEQPDPTIFQRVLDVGCGTGGWLIEAAKTYSTMSLLVGVDVSGRMTEYAQAQAEAQQVSDRVQFRTMDALLMLEFPIDYFDLVNQRFGASYLRTWDWPKLLQEFQRVTRPGGVIRVTESNLITESSSSALKRLNQVFIEAFYRAGHLFTPDSNGVTSQLARLLHQYGLENVQTHAHALEYRGGTAEGQRFYEDTRLGETLLPFIRKWTRLPEDYQTLRQQVLSDMQQPDFVATWRLLTAWGNKPS